MIRLLLAAAIGVVVSILGSRFLIVYLTKRQTFQPIQEDGVQAHLETKKSTPTLGGLAIVAAVVLGYVFSHLYNGVYTRTGLLVVGLMVGSCALGFMDDWVKVGRKKNAGITARQKSFGQIVIASTFAIGMVTLTDVHTEVSFTRWNSIGIDLGPIGWCVWAVLLIVATSNAVNLTDGLDGLAGGTSLFAYSAIGTMAFWMFGNRDIYDVPHALDLSVIAFATAGALVGFLWWNAAPAQIIMGDTGSLALGSGLAGLALTTNTHLLLPILGALFVSETLSVMIQVFVYKRTKKRVFRMAPIHHHFELLGWAETKVIIRFWLLAALCAAIALGLFYADFLSIPGSVN